jgi:DNA polymerase III delta prime subunit
MPHVASTKIKSIANETIKDGSDDKRSIPDGLFKPHMTWMISGKTGSGKSTALIRMLKAYCDAGVFQKVILISPTAAYDAKYKMLPLSEVHEEYSDDLLNQIMDEQKDDIEKYKQTQDDMKLYDKFMKEKRMTKKELLRLYTMMNPLTEEFEKPVQEFDKVPFTAVILDDLGGTSAFRNGNNALNSIVCKSRHYLTNFFVCVQHPYQCPRALRSQCSHVMLFATKDKKLLEELAKENCSHLTPDEFVELFQHSTGDPHSFMLCDFKKNEVRKNFDEVLKIQ